MMNRVKATVAYEGQILRVINRNPADYELSNRKLIKHWLKFIKIKESTRWQAAERMLAYTQMGKSFTLIPR